MANDDLTFNPLGALGLFFNPSEPDTEPDNDNGKSKDLNMRIMTCNVMNTPDLPRPAVVAAGRAVRGRASIIGAQEIGEKEDHIDMLKGLGPEYTEVFGGNRNPIFYIRGAWKVSNERVVLMHPGLAKTSGPRFVCYATFQSKTRPNLKPFIVMNTHYVSGAWNLSFNTNDGWRRDKWEQHFERQREIIQRLTADGMDIFVTGDMNRGSIMPMKKWVSKQRDFVPNGIDKISYIPGANSPLRVTKKDGPHRINTPSDHDAIMVKVELSQKEGKQ